MVVKHIPVVENILDANDQLANENRRRLDAAHIFGVNIMGSPGAGKTSLLEQTLQRLGPATRIGVIEGDLAGSIDAERVEAVGAVPVQINTGGGCHLDAVMLQRALDQLDLSLLDLIVVENVGNLVCPANFQLGTHTNVVIASVPEGDDKPYKYPGMYRKADVLVLNKVDLLPYVPFDLNYFERGARILNPDVKIFHVSCFTGQGVGFWAEWLKSQIEQAEIASK